MKFDLAIRLRIGLWCLQLCLWCLQHRLWRLQFQTLLLRLSFKIHLFYSLSKINLKPLSRLLCFHFFQLSRFKQSNETVGTGGESFLRDENGNEAQAPPSSMPTYRAAPLPDDEAQRRAIFDWAEMKLSEFAGQDSNSNASLKKRREDEIEEERR